MMTAVMMKINVSYQDALNMEFHTLKNLMNTIVNLIESGKKE